MGVFCETPIANLSEVKYALNDAEGVLDAAADLGLDTVTGAFGLIYDALVPIAAVGEVAGLRGLRPDCRRSPRSASFWMMTRIGRGDTH
jgi:hypothetical protein